MTPTGLHQWLPGRRGWTLALALYLILLGVWNFAHTDDLVGYLLGAAYVVSVVFWFNTTPFLRVQADDRGLHVRRAWWRTVDVPWVDVADIRPRRAWWSRAEMVIATQGGPVLRTGLLATDHEASLVEHWHARTGRESVPAA